MNRTVLLVILGLVTLDFTVLSGYVLLQHGYLGIWEYQFASPAGWQVLADLVIVCTLAMAWMVDDARKTGRTMWPYLLLTLTAGSFGPLLYLLIGAFGRSPVRPAYA